jgi:dTMP kinase
MFIAIDGIDGAGKTTLVRRLMHALCDLHPLSTKEPTDQSHWGKMLRAAAINGRLPREQEIDYFHKDRMEHLKDVVLPALAEGRVVITDRYVDSTLAFQTDTPPQAQALYERFLPDIVVPNVTFILNCSVEVGLARIAKRQGSVSQFEKTEFLERAQKIYASRRGHGYVQIDASGSADQTFMQAANALARRFPHLPRFEVVREETHSRAHAGAVAD